MSETEFVIKIKKGCEDCPIADSDRRTCQVISSDTSGDYKQLAYGKVKDDCPFSTAHSIVLKPMFWNKGEK